MLAHLIPFGYFYAGDHPPTPTPNPCKPPSTTTKRTLVLMAFEEVGMPGYEFDATPEEIMSAIRRLDAMMREWKVAKIDLGYNFPAILGQSDPDDESLVPDFAVTAIAAGLGEKIAPGMGKTLSPAQKRAGALAKVTLQAALARIPLMRRPSTTPRGSGNKRWFWRSPFIHDPRPDDDCECD